MHRPVRRGHPDRAGRRRQLRACSGRQAERAVALSDLTNLDALDYAQPRLRKLGRRPGAGPGRRRPRAISCTSAATRSPTSPTGSDRAADSRWWWPRSARRRSPTTTARSSAPPSRSCARRWPRLRADGHRVVVVTSGAIAAGLPVLGLGGERRPRDPVTLQAVSAVGQSRLMRVYDEALGAHGLVAGQVLIAPLDFVDRRQYLHARGTLGPAARARGRAGRQRERRAGRRRDPLRRQRPHRRARRPPGRRRRRSCCSPTPPGVLTADPRLDESASLIEEIVEVDHELEAVAGGSGLGPGQRRHVHQGGGGQDRVVVGRAHGHRRRRPRATSWSTRSAGVAGVGTVVLPRQPTARRPQAVDRVRGRVAAAPSSVDEGARRALLRGGTLAAGRRGHRRDGRLRRRRRGRGGRARRRGVRQGPQPPRRGRRGATWPVGAAASCPTACRPGSSTATTSSLLP